MTEPRYTRDYDSHLGLYRWLWPSSPWPTTAAAQAGSGRRTECFRLGISEIVSWLSQMARTRSRSVSMPTAEDPARADSTASGRPTYPRADDGEVDAAISDPLGKM